MFLKMLIVFVLSAMLVTCQACAGNISHLRESAEIDEIESLVEGTLRIELDFTAVAKLADRYAVYEGGRQGTGVVIGHVKGETIVLTVGHICEVPQGVKKGDMLMRTIQSSFTVSNSGGTHKLKAKPVRQDMSNDLCVMLVEGKIGRPVKMAGLPRRQSKVMVVGGPIGMFGDGAAYVGEGRYIGSQKSENQELSFLSVAMASGGSGSGVYHRGKLVGIVSAVSPRFNHGTVFVPMTVVKRFLER